MKKIGLLFGPTLGAFVFGYICGDFFNFNPPWSMGIALAFLTFLYTVLLFKGAGPLKEKSFLKNLSYYQKTSIKPTKGTLVVAPAFFTHTHRGNRPESGDKYILTSWLMYRKAQDLYQQGG